MDYRICSVCLWSFCMRIHMRVLGLQSLPTVFCIIGAEFCCQRNLREGAKPSMWRCLMHAWSCLTSAFWEGELLVCAADSLEWCTCCACKTTSPFLFHFSSVQFFAVQFDSVQLKRWSEILDRYVEKWFLWPEVCPRLQFLRREATVYCGKYSQIDNR